MLVNYGLGSTMSPHMQGLLMLDNNFLVVRLFESGVLTEYESFRYIHGCAEIESCVWKAA